VRPTATAASRSKAAARLPDRLVREDKTLPPEILLLGERQPGGEVLGIRPSGEIGSALSDQFKRQVRPEPRNLGDVAAKQPVQGGANVEDKVICLLLGCACGRQFADRDRRGFPQPFDPTSAVWPKKRSVISALIF
jgi:hypothetical protein